MIVGFIGDQDQWIMVFFRQKELRYVKQGQGPEIFVKTHPDDLEYARQSLAATVVRAYNSMIEAVPQATNAEETMGLYNDYLKLTGVRQKMGFASDYDLARIKTRAADAQDSVITAQAARAQAVRGIEVVASRYPAGKLATRTSFPTPPQPVPTGLPAQLLERRPDLIAAERRVAAAFHRVNEARTARVPRFARSSSTGAGSAFLNSIGTLNAVTWSLAAGITQPIFFGGELKAAEDIRAAGQRAAAASLHRHRAARL